MAARTPEQAPPLSALAERFDTQAGVAPNFLNKAPELELAALPNGEPVVFGFDDETRAQREALGKLLGAPRGYEVAQLLLLPASDNMASQSGETLKGVFLVKNLATGALSFGGVEFDDIGNIVVPKDPGARGRWPIDEGQSVKIGKAGNDLLKSEAGDDGAYIMPTRVLFSEVFSGKVDDGQLTITAEKGAFKVVSHGTNPTNILVNREQQPKEELRRLTVLGPEAQGELAQSLEVPPEVGLTTPEKHPVPLDTAQQEVREALTASDSDDVALVEAGPGLTPAIDEVRRRDFVVGSEDSHEGDDIPVELRDDLQRWGVNVESGVTRSEVADKLVKQANALERLFSVLDGDEHVVKLLNGIADSLRSRQNHIPKLSAQQVSSELARALSDLGPETLLGEPNSRSGMSSHREGLRRAVNIIDTDLFPREGFIDPDRAADVSHILLAAKNDSAVFRTMIIGAQQKAAELVGYGRSVEIADAAKSSNAENERYAMQAAWEWKKELMQSGLSPERQGAVFEEVTSNIRRAVEDAYVQGAIDVPRLAIEKMLKQPADGGEEIPSDVYVARIVAHILKGSFDVSKSNVNPIVENLKGEVELGKHRATALRILYGTNWRQAAKGMGIKIELKI